MLKYKTVLTFSVLTHLRPSIHGHLRKYFPVSGSLGSQSSPDFEKKAKHVNTETKNNFFLIKYEIYCCVWLKSKIINVFPYLKKLSHLAYNLFQTIINANFTFHKKVLEYFPWYRKLQ